MSLPTTTHDLRRLPETQPQPQPTTNNHNITITFTQFFSLLGALLTLKLYHSLSTFSRAKRPTRQSIENTEQRVVALFQAIVPEALYRVNSKCSNSGAASRHSFPCDSDGKGSGNGAGAGARSVVSASTQRTQKQGDGMIDLCNATTEEASAHSPLMRVTTNIAPAIRMSQHLSRMSGERTLELFRTATAGTTITENIPEVSLDSSHGDNRQSFASCQAQCGSVSSVAAAVAPPVSSYMAYRPYTPSTTSLACPPPHNTPESVTPTTSSVNIERHNPYAKLFMSRLLAEEEARRPMVSQRELTNESEESPTNGVIKWRFGKEEVSPGEVNEARSSIYDAECVETESDSDGDGGLRLVRSAESYPGRFPVSDGLPLEALATAPICVRGKAQTSVRPLSEV